MRRKLFSWTARASPQRVEGRILPPAGEPVTPLRKTRTPLLTPLIFHQLQVPLTCIEPRIFHRLFLILVMRNGPPPLCVTGPPVAPPTRDPVHHALQRGPALVGPAARKPFGRTSSRTEDRRQARG
jgi:hypothetical protein